MSSLASFARRSTAKGLHPTVPLEKARPASLRSTPLLPSTALPPQQALERPSPFLWSMRADRSTQNRRGHRLSRAPFQFVIVLLNVHDPRCRLQPYIFFARQPIEMRLPNCDLPLHQCRWFVRAVAQEIGTRISRNVQTKPDRPTAIDPKRHSRNLRAASTGYRWSQFVRPTPPQLHRRAVVPAGLGWL